MDGKITVPGSASWKFLLLVFEMAKSKVRFLEQEFWVQCVFSARWKLHFDSKMRKKRTAIECCFVVFEFYSFCVKCQDELERIVKLCWFCCG